LTKIWALRNGSGNTDGTVNNDAEDKYGNNVAASLYWLGSGLSPTQNSTPNSNAAGVEIYPPSSVTDGSTLPATGKRSLYLTQPSSNYPLNNHNSSAMDLYYQASVKKNLGLDFLK